jgi:hypothetical protein
VLKEDLLNSFLTHLKAVHHIDAVIDGKVVKTVPISFDEISRTFSEVVLPVAQEYRFCSAAGKVILTKRALPSGGPLTLKVEQPGGMIVPSSLIE